MKHAPHSYQHHDLYRQYQGQDTEICGLLGKCGILLDKDHTAVMHKRQKAANHCTDKLVIVLNVIAHMEKGGAERQLMLLSHPSRHHRCSTGTNILPMYRWRGYRTDMKIAADFEYVARLFRNGKLRAAYVSETWGRMQTGGTSTSGLRSTLTLKSEISAACRMNGIATSWPTIFLEIQLENQRAVAN